MNAEVQHWHQGWLGEIPELALAIVRALRLLANPTGTLRDSNANANEIVTILGHQKCLLC